jgi:anti-sigma B factor antagonist
MDFHEDAIVTESIIARYILRTLDEKMREEFEQHYLMCDLCFEELRASELLVIGLQRSGVYRKSVGQVSVLQFVNSADLVRESAAVRELRRALFEQNDSKVLVDLSNVSRIDSAGLGMLMECYSHAVMNRGVLKLFNPSPQVRKALSITKLGSILETYPDENAAVRAFEK